MDITQQELKTMKVKQLRRLIREAITEVLNEETFAGKNAVADLKTYAGYASLSADAKSNAEKKLQKGGSVTLEGELEEMANTPKGYTISDENMDLSQFVNQKLRGVSLTDFLTFIKENPGVGEKQIATQFGFERQQPINALMASLRDKGIVTRLDKTGQPEVPKAPGEEDEEEVVTGPDAFFIGKGDPLTGMFDGEPNDDGSEDFNDSEEPTLPKTQEPFKVTGPVAKAAEFTTDNDRLIQKIINIYGASKLRVKEVSGDEELSGSDFSKAEKGRKETAAEQLPKLIQQLADKISTEDKETQDAILAILAKKFASVGYTSLSKKIAAALGATAPQVQEPEMDDLGLEDEEDTIDEAFDAEYTKRKLQFYAGIIR